MKCQNCHSAEYIDSFDTCIENGYKHRVYICPICDDIHTERIIPKQHNYRLYKSKLVDIIGITGTMITIFIIVFYILIHLDKFSTII